MNLELLFLIAVPFAGGLLVIFPGRFLKVLRWILSILTILATGFFLYLNFSHGGLKGLTFWHLLGSTDAAQFSASPVFIFIAAAFLLLWLVVVLYSFGFFKKGEGGEEADTEYYAVTLFMLGSVLGLLFTNDLVFLYIFWEIAAITTWRLVGFERTGEKISIASKTILVNFFGSALMLVGFLLLVLQFGSFNLADMVGEKIPILAGVLILAGIFAKSAVIPLYIWLPDAHPAAPSPTSALLSGVIVKIGLVAYIKLFNQTFVTTPEWRIAILWIVLISSLVAGGAALVERDFKRILAYSTVSQVAFVFAGLVAVMELSGFIGAVIYIVAHSLAKGTLFLAYGVVAHETGQRDIKYIGRLAGHMPLVFVAVMIASLSIIGLPPFFGFFAKVGVIYGVISSGALLAAGGFILASILTLLYMLRLFSKVFLGGKKPDIEIRQPVYLSVLVFVLSLILLLGSAGVGPIVEYLGGVK